MKFENCNEVKIAHFEIQLSTQNKQKNFGYFVGLSFYSNNTMSSVITGERGGSSCKIMIVSVMIS